MVCRKELGAWEWGVKSGTRPKPETPLSAAGRLMAKGARKAPIFDDKFMKACASDSG